MPRGAQVPPVPCTCLHGEAALAVVAEAHGGHRGLALSLRRGHGAAVPGQLQVALSQVWGQKESTVRRWSGQGGTRSEAALGIWESLLPSPCPEGIPAAGSCCHQHQGLTGELPHPEIPNPKPQIPNPKCQIPNPKCQGSAPCSSTTGFAFPSLSSQMFQAKLWELRGADPWLCIHWAGSGKWERERGRERKGEKGTL